MFNGIVTGALWKVSHNAENVDRLEDLGIVPTLIKVNSKVYNGVTVFSFNSITWLGTNLYFIDVFHASFWLKTRKHSMTYNSIRPRSMY